MQIVMLMSYIYNPVVRLQFSNKAWKTESINISSNIQDERKMMLTDNTVCFERLYSKCRTLTILLEVSSKLINIFNSIVEPVYFYK